MFAIPSAMFTVLRLFPSLQARHVRLALLASFIPLGAIGWLHATALALLLPTPMVVLSLAGLLIHLWWLLTFFGPRPSPSVERTGLRLLSLNLRYGWADPGTVAQRLTEADVAVLVEVTPQALAALEPLVLNDFPHRAGHPARGGTGTMICSRWPITHQLTVPNLTTGAHLAVVQHPDSGCLVQIAGVHPSNPIRGVQRWLRDAKTITDAIAAAADPSLPLVVAGDFNATPDHVTLRGLQRGLGLHNAAAASGSGWLPTWPAYRRRIPRPLLPIDHVLIGPGVQVRRVTRWPAHPSDHYGLTAELSIAGSVGSSTA